MSEPTRVHYERLAANYDQVWSHSPAFLDWMSAAINTRLFPDGDAARAMDLGCGTGLFASNLRAHTVLCVDPSGEMLAQIADRPGLTPLRATAEDVASGNCGLPGQEFDAILIKEAIHHIAEPGPVLTGVSKLLAPNGRLLVVMLPSSIDYPLFPAALELFERRQPDPRDIADSMREAELDVSLTYEAFRLSFQRDRYVAMVRARYMSLLSEFDDAELEAGIAQIPAGESLEFNDRFAFILGTRA